MCKRSQLFKSRAAQAAELVYNSRVDPSVTQSHRAAFPEGQDAASLLNKITVNAYYYVYSTKCQLKVDSVQRMGITSRD
jgi:hypothetical protein